jgi:CheY-like chemotaxis protein
LVVEDNADLRHFIASALEPRFRVTTASNGQYVASAARSAIGVTVLFRIGYEKAQEVLPDVILSDVQMPVMSGEQLAVAIRGNPLLKATPIVMLTARSDESLRLRLVCLSLCCFMGACADLVGAVADRSSGISFKAIFSSGVNVTSLLLALPWLLRLNGLARSVRLENMALMKLARTRMQAELQTSVENVAELSLQLADKNARLQQALLESQRVQNMKDEFLLTLSHELRMPLFPSDVR